MSNSVAALQGHGDLLIFLGTICVIFGWIVAAIERTHQSNAPRAANWVIAAVAGLLSLGGATTVLIIEPLGLLWGAAALGMSVTVAAVVGVRIVGVLSLVSIGGN